MRSLALVGCLVGCGRIGFDPSGDGGNTGNSDGQVFQDAMGTTPMLCDVTPTGATGIPSTTGVHAVQTTNGYVVALQTLSQDILIYEVSNTFQLIAQHDLMVDLELYDIGAVGSTVFIDAGPATLASNQVQLLSPTLDSLTLVGTSFTGVPYVTPMFATFGAQIAFASLTGTNFTLETLDSSGNVTGTLGTSSTTSRASVSSSTSGLLVATSLTSNMSEAYSVAPDGTPGQPHTFASASVSMIGVSLPGDNGVAFYETSPGTVVADVLPSATNPSDVMVPVGTNVTQIEVAAAVGEDAVMAWGNGGNLTSIAQDGSSHTTSGWPFASGAIVGSPNPAMFWIDSNDGITGARLCLQ